MLFVHYHSSYFAFVQWNCCWFFFFFKYCWVDKVIFLFHCGTAVKWEVFGSKGDGCESEREIISRSRSYGFLVQVGYHSWSWGGDCLNTGSCKNRLYNSWDNQIWEGGSQSQSLRCWNLGQRCWTLGTCSRGGVTDTSLRRQFNVKEGGKTIC